MSNQKPSVGRTVQYVLSAEDAEQVNRRRTDGASIAARIAKDTWPVGAQAHIGNRASEGDVRPMVIVQVWPDEYGPDLDGVNGQVFLDGNDTFWATSVKEGEGTGTWRWPPRV